MKTRTKGIIASIEDAIHSTAEDTEARLTTAELLLHVSNRIATIETLDEQLEAVISMVIEATGAEVSTLFLNDDSRGELYSRVTIGQQKREIRMLNTLGIAGRVFQTNEGMIVNDPYHNEFFNEHIDQNTGFTTRNMICTPIRTMRGETIGVAQALNKKSDFTKKDLTLLGAMISQASIVLQSTLLMARMEQAREKEAVFLRVVSDVSSEIQLGPLLQKIMAAITRMLNSERSTLFLNDERTNELYTEIGEGLGAERIRFPNDKGIAGAVFTLGESVNIPHAYADLRFNPEFDKQTNFFTRSILCVPVSNKDGKRIGVTQILNRRGGPFTEEDERRLKAFTAQISIALENAKLFDEVQATKNYNESMLESMSNGVITTNEEGVIVTCNQPGLRILGVEASRILNRPIDEFFVDGNAWIAEKVRQTAAEHTSDIVVDTEIVLDSSISANLTFQPLIGQDRGNLGALLLIEDISSEKRVKSTMSRYMDAGVMEKLLEAGDEILGGVSSEATVLFSDIRSFTPLTEELGAQGTVKLLNEYFGLMVDCILSEGGMLDKFIGDAIMAVFGTPMPHEDDPDRAMRSAIDMLAHLRDFNDTRQQHGLAPIKMGVGINTGNVVSGNIGSPKRMDYTVIGDAVNLAARLESACKHYGSEFLVSENTFDHARGIYIHREMDKVIVKGKTEPVSIYEVLDFHTEESFPRMRDVLGLSNSGLERFRKQEWEPAIKTFEEILELRPDDTMAKIYIERTRHYEENPPGDDWDGVWTMTSK